MKKERVGIFGGTFSPPHNAHVRAAEAFANAITPDVLLIIPDYLPPHKEIDGLVTAEERLEMCRLAFGHIKNAKISDMEIKRGGRSYTYQTLEELTAPDKELYLLCGTDMFLTLDEWKLPERIFDLATICYVRREKDAADMIAEKRALYESRYSAKIIEVSLFAMELSSTSVRKSLLDGDGAAELLPTAVYEYIKNGGLYGDK